MNISVREDDMINQMRGEFVKVKGNQLTWYIPSDGNVDRIHMDCGGGGYYDAEFEITLIDGTVDLVVGPWNSNEHSFHWDTGLSIQDALKQAI